MFIFERVTSDFKKQTTLTFIMPDCCKSTQRTDTYSTSEVVEALGAYFAEEEANNQEMVQLLLNMIKMEAKHKATQKPAEKAAEKALNPVAQLQKAVLEHVKTVQQDLEKYAQLIFPIFPTELMKTTTGFLKNLNNSLTSLTNMVGLESPRELNLGENTMKESIKEFAKLIEVFPMLNTSALRPGDYNYIDIAKFSKDITQTPEPATRERKPAQTTFRTPPSYPPPGGPPPAPKKEQPKRDVSEGSIPFPEIDSERGMLETMVKLAQMSPFEQKQPTPKEPEPTSEESDSSQEDVIFPRRFLRPESEDYTYDVISQKPMTSLSEDEITTNVHPMRCKSNTGGTLDLLGAESQDETDYDDMS